MTSSRPRRAPLVTVVLPVRDGAATLEAALQSLGAQTFSDFEVIVVDDGSGDDTARVARRWERRDGRFRLVCTPPRGIVSALRRGLAEARGTLVARMDADDVCHPARLATQVDLLERRPELAGCGTGVRYVPAGSVTARAAEYAAWLNAMTTWETVAANIFVECPLAHPTIMFRASALSAVDGYRDRGWPEDYDLLLRLWRHGHRFVSVRRVLLDWNNRGDRLSRTHPAYSLAAFRACRVHHLRRSLLTGRSGVVIWGAGPTGKKLALEFHRQEVAVRAFIEVDPRKIGQVIHGAPVREAAAAKGFRDALHLGAVARSTGRETVRAAVVGEGLSDGVDFVAMA
ncbi:MAG: glycosyltransferase [Gemmatimonadota bacterium]|nr:glycosyltransferase [Gemmatimonadota bacterium]